MTPAFPVDLTDDEIANLCQPLKQKAAQVKHLRAMGLTVRTTRDGRPLVNREHYNAVMCGRTLEPGEAAKMADASNDAPNVAGLAEWHKRRSSRGTKTKG